MIDSIDWAELVRESSSFIWMSEHLNQRFNLFPPISVSIRFSSKMHSNERVLKGLSKFWNDTNYIVLFYKIGFLHSLANFFFVFTIFFRVLKFYL